MNDGSSAWQEKSFAQDYTDNAGNPEKNWYEHEVNFPNLVTMLPSDAQRVLDYGSGPGEFTALLGETFPEVDGTDFSESMVEIAAKAYPGIRFFAWNDRFSFLQKGQVRPYDAILSKLTLHFVEDLDEFARDLKPLLVRGGVLVFSVPHPFSSLSKAGSYWPMSHYDTEIGVYGMSVTMIHRNIEDYLQPFVNNGYQLACIREPQTPKALAEQHGETGAERITPRRLNVSFRLGEQP